ncbi:MULTISPECIES: SPFH domain-containing protein [Thiothrix]|jgi:regulator of protease activity HflC (stomatin/prohibitin superfamily)|uniref:SPFH/Band 7/PHB domain protein n=2 Tax=Thiothrix TaxID=1030 RepID=A0A975F9L6_9GAMM|nr:MULTISPECIES: SPFH domain-containing protein [Thiothrix]MDX9987019.1 SPFH domain-containing protein [Thiothrix unzii]OQX14439.1 MAG: paraslipin [Thiothrix lacustris]QTR53444.1 SPFH/Band 7/PHB domain protein [Thiothrix unzii]
MTSFAIAILVFIVALIFMGVKMVPQGFAYTVERFGRYVYTLQPGLGLLVPVIYQVGRKVNMMEQVLDILPQQVITADNANVNIDGVVFYQVFDPAKASYEVANLQHAILNLIMTNLRSVCGGLELDHLLSKRDEIGVRVLTIVDEATSAWGVKVLRVEIKDIEPPQELVRAMNLQMTAERQKRAQITEAEGKKQSQILEAEGAKSAAFLRAEAREREALAEAKATQMVSQAVAQGDVQALNYFVAQKYVEALGKFADSNQQKTIFMPLDTSGLMGSIGSINELWKAMKDKT